MYHSPSRNSKILPKKMCLAYPHGFASLPINIFFCVKHTRTSINKIPHMRVHILTWRTFVSWLYHKAKAFIFFGGKVSILVIPFCHGTNPFWLKFLPRPNPQSLRISKHRFINKKSFYQWNVLLSKFFGSHAGKKIRPHTIQYKVFISYFRASFFG